jgi:hypothetical protein
LHGLNDAESVARLRLALRDRAVLQGYELRGYARDAAGDLAMFAPRNRLPRWLPRRFRGRVDPCDGQVGADVQTDEALRARASGEAVGEVRFLAFNAYLAAGMGRAGCCGDRLWVHVHTDDSAV